MPESNRNANQSQRPSLDPDEEAMRQLGYDLIDRLVDHFESLPEQQIVQRCTNADFAKIVNEPPPSSGASTVDSLDCFLDRIVPGMTRVNHPRFHGYIPAPSSFAGIMGGVPGGGDQYTCNLDARWPPSWSSVKNNLRLQELRRAMKTTPARIKPAHLGFPPCSK